MSRLEVKSRNRPFLQLVLKVFFKFLFLICNSRNGTCHYHRVVKSAAFLKVSISPGLKEIAVIASYLCVTSSVPYADLIM